MKRSLHFYKWFVAVVVLICSTTTMSAQTKVTGLSQLKAGSVIKIYPKEGYGTSHYGESKYALACSGYRQPLTSLEKAGSGDKWTLEDAGNGNYYLKNNNGCYWAYQGSTSSNSSLECTMEKNSAVKIHLTWDTKYSGVCFWNTKDGRGLNNLDGYNYRYNWWSNPNDYSGDANTTFDIAILSDDNGGEVIKPDEGGEVTKPGEKVTDVNLLQTGDVIEIYPYGHYDEASMALSCKGDGMDLTTYAKAGKGSEWTLIDAGSGYYYLKNELGCYWAYQEVSYIPLTCTMDINSAAKVKLTWDSRNKGGCFWNQKDGTGLSHIYNNNTEYFWNSSPDHYSSDTNTTFEVKVRETNIAVIDGIKYLLRSKQKTAKVLKNNYEGNIVIPQMVSYEGNEFRVTSLENECFYCCSNLTSVTLPKGITSLGDDCFGNCESLTNVTLPEGITSLGYYCFGGCYSLTDITLPKGITSLEEMCFYSCHSLTSITLPEGITSLGDGCFDGCWRLTSIILPKGITSLGYGCFQGCWSLTSITLPEGITSLGTKCFKGCKNLTSVSFPATLKEINKEIFLDATQKKRIIINAPIPPSGGEFIDSNYTLYIPKGTLASYKNTESWNLAGAFYEGKPIESINLPSDISFEKTEKKKAKYSILPIDANQECLKWSCDNSTVVSIDEKTREITALKVGNATITATVDDGTGISASTIAHVTPLKVQTMIFAEPSVSIVKTEDKTITLTLNSEEVDNKNMVWTSSDESVATVVQNMNAVYPLEAIVVAHKVGKATIKAEAQDGSGMSATCEVEVTPLMASDISLLSASVVKTIPTQLEANVSPTEADNKKLKWTSLTPDIATVTEDGTMTGLKMGTAKVKAETTDGSNLSVVFEVQVLGLSVSTISLPAESSIIKTESMKLEYSILPLASDNQKLKWSSNATDIVSVDESTGVITAHKVGDAIITATATDGSDISASTKIHVTPLKISQIEMSKEMSLLHSLSKQIEVKITPELADNKTLKWISDNEDIATVNQEGVVTGVNVGSANVTATTTDGTELSATCKVTVNPVTINLSTNTINLQKGSEYVEQTATVLPENYEHKDVVWTTSGNGVTSVDKDGHITANKPGVDTLRCSLSYDSHIYSECRVIVYEDNVVYVGGLYYLLKGTTDDTREATVTSIYGGKNTSLDAKNVAQYYSGTINIPETIIYDGNKYTVRKVGSYAFNCQNELQSIYIPRTVTEVEPHAAIKAEKLNRVNVADESELVNIGEEAFKWCTGLKRFTFDGTSLKMNSIDKAAFRECTALERFTWMGNTTVKTIGHSAFYDCPALEKVLWNGKSELKTIQDYAFFKCISLNNFEMPNTTLSVGNSSFRYNASLTNIHLSNSLNYIDEYAYGECGFSQITLPESLANIQAGVFINNEFLQEIILPERLQGLGSAAFENNSKLESVTFHTAIETMTIGNNAFNQCPILNKVYITNMNSFAQTNFNNAKANPANTSQHIYDANGKEIINVVLPKGTKYINNNAFNGCAFIESIEMPATMDHVNDDIFVGCSALKDVYCYAEEVPEFIGVNNPASMDEVFQNATLHVPFGSESLYQKDTKWWGKFTKLLGCEPKPTAVVEKIDLSTLTVNVKAGENYNEQKLTIYPAEAANVRIKYSTADRKVADIDENGVIKGVAPGVTTIYYTANDGNGVTSECKVIVRNPEVEYVGDIYYLFDKAKKVATVTSIYGGKNKSLEAEKVAQVYTGTVSIPEQTTFNAVTYDVKKVGGYAFTCQNTLQALRVGAFVEKIEDNAATKAMNLNRVTVANASQLVTVGKRSFMDCAGLQHVLFEGTTQYLDVIDTAAFKNCAKLEDVIWEGKSKLRLIGDSAFYCDSKLETMKWNDKCDLKIIDNYAFYKCSSLNHFIMPNSTLSVGKYAFRYDAGLTDIQLSTSLSIIYDYAFGECGFSQIVLPESLKSMQAGAFINNSNLADITIPKKTEGIGAGAFENCSALESVTFKTHETKLTVDKNAFNHCPVLSKVNIDYLDDWAHINFQNAAANPASTARRLYLNGEEMIDIELPVGTKYIGNNVFNGCSDIRTLKIPATVEHVNDNIIAGCSSLTDVYCYATKVPSFIGTEDPSSMNDVFRKATLHVIYGNEEAYKADAWWKRFYKIEGCNAPSDADKKVTSITISQTEATLKPNDTMQLEATVYPTDAANKKILWTSSNEDVVIVTDEGFVLAVAEGEADVTVASAENSEIKAVCHIKVEKEKEPEVPIVQIKFEESPVTIALGETKKLNVIFNPVNATNKELDWVSAQTSVVEVDKEGNILGVSEGKAIVSAKTKDGSNLTINCVVTVIPSTGISNITMGEVKLIVNNRHLKVEGLADHEVIQVVNSIGFTVYRGTDHEVDLNASGIYIVKMRGKTVKFNVK